MSTTARTVATAAAWVVAGALGATVLTGVAGAVATGPAAIGGMPAAVAAASSMPAGDQVRHGMMRDVLHGSFTVATDDGTAVVDVQRGEITAASATSVTVRSSDGFVATYAIGSDTSVRRDRDSATGADLVVGDTVRVRATAGTADVVRAFSPEAVAKLGDAGGWGSGRHGRGGMGGGMGGGMNGGMGGMGLGSDADADADAA